MCIYIYINIGAYVYTYIHIHIHTHTHIYIYTHANTRLDLRNAANSLQIEGKGVLPGDPYHWGGWNTERETISAGEIPPFFLHKHPPASRLARLLFQAGFLELLSVVRLEKP